MSKIPLYLFQVLEAEYAALYRKSPAESYSVSPGESPKKVKLVNPRAETEEYSASNGDGSARSEPKKTPHEVVPTFDWTFDASHIKDAEGFIRELNLTTTPGVAATPAADELNQSLWARIKSTAARFRKGVVRIARRVYNGRVLSAVEDPDKLAKDKLIAYLRDELRKKSRVQSLTSNPESLADALNEFFPTADLFREERFSNYWLDSMTQGMRDIHTSTRLEGDDLAHFNRLLLEAAFPDHFEKIHIIRLAAIYQLIHEKKPAALCLSGGGIRSGTFALGLMQGFARHELLDKFHYLSTVSGGGYMGSWLAAWIHRHPEGLKGVTAELKNSGPRTKVDPDPEPIRYLRRYTNFITPQVGALSADTWTFIGIYLRNLLLNWMVFIPLLLGVLMLPRLVVALTIAPPAQQSLLDLIVPNFSFAGRYWFLALGLILIVWSMAYIMFNRPSVREELRQASRVWRSKSTQRYFLSCCLLPLTGAAFCMTTYWIWSVQSRTLPKNILAFFGFGVVTTASAWIVSSWTLGRLRSIKAISSSINSQRRSLNSFKAYLRLFALPLAGLGGAGLLWLATISFRAAQENVEDFSSRVYPPWKWSAWILEFYGCFAVPGFLLVFLLGVTLYIGGSSKSPRINDEDREWWSRLSAWVLIVILGWSVFNVLVIFGPVALLSAPAILSSFGGISGVLAALAGRSAKTPSHGKSPNGSEKPGILDAVMGKVLPLLALSFIVFLLTFLSLITSGILAGSAYIPKIFSQSGEFVSHVKSINFDLQNPYFWHVLKLAHMNLVHLTPFWFAFLLFVLLVGTGLGISLAVNLNIFSLHGGYRNRLIRAFLGASRADTQRKPNPFTGFDPADNISMHELRTGLFDEDDILKPVELARELLNRNNGAALTGKQPTEHVIEYLSRPGVMKSLASVPNPHDYSTRLVAALRTDLNQALQDAGLTECYAKKPTTELEQKRADKKAENRWTKRDHRRIWVNRKILERTFPHYLKRKEEDKTYRLLPVINTTLNLVGGDNLAWQQRKAEPFSVSPLYAGCFRLGYRESKNYGGHDTGGISIGTAAAISGAAASSNMGYYTTSPVLSLVLTFFNVRLGWWLGNPGPAGNRSFDKPCPTSSVRPVLDEALGLTDDENAYVYLTDGGHFENLGLYEMVLRRCNVIVVSDAAADSDYRFGDLGNAIRKVRIDLGIPIEFTAMPIFRPEPGESRKGMYWAIGRIRYSCIDGRHIKDGLLLYIKPAIYGDEPRDVLEYKKSNPAFPHQSTADQFFDEPQFESYRILGSHVMDHMCGPGFDGLELAVAIRKAVEKLLDGCNGGPADPQLKDWWEKWRVEDTRNSGSLSWLIS